MSLHIHHLHGCTPTPLAAYLKALGIFRLVSNQADDQARGCWRDEHFVLFTRLDEEELERFFLESYAPTPFVSPWNKGGGFLTHDRFLTVMEQSPLPRLAPFQEGIRAGRALCSELEKADAAVRKIKDEPKPLSKKEKEKYKAQPEYKKRLAAANREFARIKGSFLPMCRLFWRGPHLDWMDAAMILRDDGTPAFPALLGTGGNDGRFDFTKNFMEQFQTLFDVTSPDAPVPEKTASLLRHALFGTPELGTGNFNIGQYHPGAAGGANSSNGLDGRGNVNPWDFLLTFEGSMLFSAAASKRLGTTSLSAVSAPFAVHSASGGHVSSSVAEDSAKGEQWMPLWDRPVSLAELSGLLGEGRAQVDRTPTRQPVDLARAIARLGVSRGITAFERYAYLERNGQANFAVPLGRWQVVTQPNQELLADIDTWMGRFQRASRAKGAPARLGMLARRLTDAVFAVTAHGSEPSRWQELLLVLADIDASIAVGTGISAGVLSGLRPGWLAAADDGSPEIRLALSLAAQYGIRHHWLPLDRFGRLATVDEGKRLASDPRVVCFGRDLVSDAVAVVKRRIIETTMNHDGLFDMTPIRPDLTVDLRDLSSFLLGGLDHDRILRLSRALMMLDPVALRDTPNPLQRPVGHRIPVDDAYVMTRFCMLPCHLSREKEWQIPVCEAVFLRLAAGDLTGAIRRARQHLKAHGLNPPIQVAIGPSHLLAASMAFPISRTSRNEMHRSFISSTIEKGA